MIIITYYLTKIQCIIITKKITYFVLMEENTMGDKLILNKKYGLKGEDGHRVFSVRIKEVIVDELDRISKETGHSRNELINIFLDYAIQNLEIK